MTLATGGVLPETTVSRNDVAVINSPSLTRTVIVVVPDAVGRGVAVRVTSAPLRVTLRLVMGTRAVLELSTRISRSSGAVVLSPIVNSSGPVEEPAGMDKSVIGVMVGAVLGGVVTGDTTNRNEVNAESSP